MCQSTARGYGGVAQLGEHLPCKQGVKSSNLSVSIADEGNRVVCRLYLENRILKNLEISRKDIRGYHENDTKNAIKML